MDFKSPLHFNEFPPISLEKWESVIEKDLKGKNYKDVLLWKSPEGIDVLPFYRKENLKNLQRVPNPVLKSGGWNIVEAIESPDVKEANRQALQALENGASGLFFELSEEVVNSKEDLEQLLQGIQIELITLKFDHLISSPQTAQWLVEISEKQNLNIGELDIYFSFDPMAEALYSGTLAEGSALQEEIEQFNAPFKLPSVDISAYGNAGATIIQQLAFALAAGNEYLGLNPKLAQSIHFNFSTGPSYFPEIAKFRAFKLLWKQVLQKYGMEGAPIILHAETALWNKSQTDAHNNMLRTTTEAMSAALGGCDAITVHRYDKHFAEESGFAARIARNTQILLQEEAYLDKVADVGAGSYYIEVLTDTLAEESWKLFQKIEEKGGFVECLKSGFIQSEINTSREEKIKAYQEKEEVLVGVNKYQPEEIKDSRIKLKNYSGNNLERTAFTDIKKVEPLNLEEELQKGDA